METLIADRIAEAGRRPTNIPREMPPTPAPSTSPELPLDYRLLLLSLADQYINQARSLSADIANGQAGVTADDYYKLMSTAFCCYQAVISGSFGEVQPRDEATVLLQYATLLYEETDNYQDIEHMLFKGTELCGRNKILDLKYSMQLLIFRTKFRHEGARVFKAVDRLIMEAVKEKHTVWMYALRFLRVSFSLQVDTPHELHACISQLNAVFATSSEVGDKSLSAVARLMQAYIHLRRRSAESLTEAQQAIASARATLMSLGNSAKPQFMMMLTMLDLVCNLDPLRREVSQKTKAMQQSSQDRERGELANDMGLYHIPLERSKGGTLTRETGGLFTIDRNGRESLNFTWLTGVDSVTLGHVLGGAAHLPDPMGTISFLVDAFDRTNPDSALTKNRPSSDTLCLAYDRLRQRIIWRCYTLVHATLTACIMSQWSNARQSLEAQLLPTMNTLGHSLPLELVQLYTYVAGVVAQMTGDFSGAIEKYSSNMLALAVREPSTRAANTIQNNLSLLASLNLLLLHYDPSLQADPQVLDLLAKVTTHFYTKVGGTPLEGLNPHLCSAYYLVKALYANKQPFGLVKKQGAPQKVQKKFMERRAALDSAIAQATSIHNHQLMTLAHGCMYEVFYRDIIDPDSYAHARVAFQRAYDQDNKTYMCVCAQMLIEVEQLDGLDNHEHAMRTFKGEAQKFVNFLPGELGLIKTILKTPQMTTTGIEEAACSSQTIVLD